MVPFSITLTDLNLDFMTTQLLYDALDVLRAQLTRDLFVIAKFLVFNDRE